MDFVGRNFTTKKEVEDGKWYVIGDFNAIRRREERKRRGGGCQQRSCKLVEFNAFIDNMEVIELPFVGRRFSWIRAGGGAMNRLDKALVSLEWLQEWPNSTQYVLDRSISNCCLIIVKHYNIDWGPRPFKICNYWIEEPWFVDFVKKKKI